MLPCFVLNRSHRFNHVHLYIYCMCAWVCACVCVRVHIHVQVHVHRWYVCVDYFSDTIFPPSHFYPSFHFFPCLFSVSSSTPTPSPLPLPFLISSSFFSSPLPSSSPSLLSSPLPSHLPSPPLLSFCLPSPLLPLSLTPPMHAEVTGLTTGPCSPAVGL